MSANAMDESYIAIGSHIEEFVQEKIRLGEYVDFS